MKRIHSKATERARASLPELERMAKAELQNLQISTCKRCLPQIFFWGKKPGERNPIINWNRIFEGQFADWEILLSGRWWIDDLVPQERVEKEVSDKAGIAMRRWICLWHWPMWFDDVCRWDVPTWFWLASCYLLLQLVTAGKHHTNKDRSFVMLIYHLIKTCYENLRIMCNF